MIEEINESLSKAGAYGLTTIFLIALALLFFFIVSKREELYFPINWFIPLLAAFAWLSLKPAMDYEAGSRFFDRYSTFKRVMPWYGDTAWQYGIFWLILICGYVIVYFVAKERSNRW